MKHALSLAVALLAPAALAAQSYDDLVRRLDYDRNAPLHLEEAGVQDRGAVKVHDVSYASPKGGRVPAYLVVPEGRGPFAGVVWGHWYWDNSPMRNRSEFLDEAVAIAKSGVASIMIDGPVARPGHVEDRTPMNEQQITDLIQAILDMRRAADVLVARKDVDAARLGYVGHSYNASVGAFLSGIDRRFKAFVLMAGSLSDKIDQQSKEYQDHRVKVGAEKWDAVIARVGWLDPGNFVSHAAPAAVFMQYATDEDSILTPARVRQYADIVTEPKQFKLYRAPHALNAEARRDRIEFLRQQLRLGAIDWAAVAKVPELVQPPEPKQ